LNFIKFIGRINQLRTEAYNSQIDISGHKKI